MELEYNVILDIELVQVSTHNPYACMLALTICVCMYVTMYVCMYTFLYTLCIQF